MHLYGPRATAWRVQAHLTCFLETGGTATGIASRTFCPDETILNGHVLIMTGYCPVTAAIYFLE